MHWLDHGLRNGMSLDYFAAAPTGCCIYYETTTFAAFIVSLKQISLFNSLSTASLIRYSPGCDNKNLKLEYGSAARKGKNSPPATMHGGVIRDGNGVEGSVINVKTTRYLSHCVQSLCP